MRLILKISLFAAAALVTAGCAPMTGYNLGGGSGAVTGSAGIGKSYSAAKEIGRCYRPMGSVTVIESEYQRGIYVSYSRNYNLPQSVVPLVRLMIQQSNCFTVVDRHRGLSESMREIELAKKGYLRSRSRIRKGLIREADFTITPTLIFSERDAGGASAALSTLSNALWGGSGRWVGQIAGDLKFSEAQTTLALVDNRTLEQIGMAEGSASKTDIGAGFGFLSSIRGGARGWQNTNEGKVVAAAFLDAISKLVQVVEYDSGSRYGSRGRYDSRARNDDSRYNNDSRSRYNSRDSFDYNRRY